MRSRPASDLRAQVAVLLALAATVSSMQDRVARQRARLAGDDHTAASAVDDVAACSHRIEEMVGIVDSIACRADFAAQSIAAARGTRSRVASSGEADASDLADAADPDGIVATLERIAGLLDGLGAESGEPPIAALVEQVALSTQRLRRQATALAETAAGCMVVDVALHGTPSMKDGAVAGASPAASHSTCLVTFDVDGAAA